MEKARQFWKPFPVWESRMPQFKSIYKFNVWDGVAVFRLRDQVCLDEAIINFEYFFSLFMFHFHLEQRTKGMSCLTRCVIWQTRLLWVRITKGNWAKLNNWIHFLKDSSPWPLRTFSCFSSWPSFGLLKDPEGRLGHQIVCRQAHTHTHSPQYCRYC